MNQNSETNEEIILEAKVEDISQLIFNEEKLAKKVVSSEAKPSEKSYIYKIFVRNARKTFKYHTYLFTNKNESVSVDEFHNLRKVKIAKNGCKEFDHMYSIDPLHEEMKKKNLFDIWTNSKTLEGIEEDSDAILWSCRDIDKPWEYNVRILVRLDCKKG